MNKIGIFFFGKIISLTYYKCWAHVEVSLYNARFVFLIPMPITIQIDERKKNTIQIQKKRGKLK